MNRSNLQKVLEMEEKRTFEHLIVLWKIIYWVCFTLNM